MIEEGFYNNNISTAVLEEYLSYTPFQNIDGLVLACTHYPLIKNEINSFFKGKVKLFDSAQVVAARLQWILQKENLLAVKRTGSNHFFVSDFTASFEQSTRIFFRHQVQLQHISLT